MTFSVSLHPPGGEPVQRPPEPIPRSAGTGASKIWPGRNERTTLRPFPPAGPVRAWLSRLKRLAAVSLAPTGGREPGPTNSGKSLHLPKRVTSLAIRTSGPSPALPHEQPDTARQRLSARRETLRRSVTRTTDGPATTTSNEHPRHHRFRG